MKNKGMTERPKLQRSISTVKRQFRWRTPIRPFISSTFLDFQEERGHLQRYVFPQLNSSCHARGTYFAPADLRWGINDEQAQSGNVVSLCLEYINRCSPFFICLLGERYGTHRPSDAPPLKPSQSVGKLSRRAMSWLDRNYLIAASKGHDWILQEAYQHCSVTELEIIQAAFLNDSRFCRFYVRDVRHIEDKFPDLPQQEREEKLKIYSAENDETEMKVTALKHRIINKGLKVQFFRTPEELGQKVLEDWMEVINEFYPPLDELLGDVDGEQFREWAAHEAYAETRRRVFVQTPEIQKLYTKMTNHCEAWIDPTTPGTAAKMPEWTVVKGKKNKQDDAPVTKSVLTLVGERGCGKTSLVANWVKSFQSSNPDVRVLAHYVGSSALSTDVRSFLRRVTFELRGEFGGEGPSESNTDSEELSNFHRICEAFVAAIAMGPCILVLDAIDELGSTMGMGVHQVKEMKWLPASLPPHCKIIVTTVRSDLTYRSLSARRDTETMSVPLFGSTADKAAVIERHLALHCKCLDAGHLATIVSCPLSSRPLFLTVLASELRVCGTFDNLGKLLERYAKAPSFRDLWKCIISRWTREYGWSTEGRLSMSMSNYQQIDPYTGWVAETLRLLACSRHGLSESDILSLLRQMGYKGQSEVTSFDFALFRSAAFDALVERPGGLFGFFHQDLRDAVLNSLLGVIPGLTNEQSTSGTNFLPQMLNGQMQQCHEHLADYFLRRPGSRRRVEELPYHLDRCGDVNGLNKVVTNPDTFLAMHADTSQNIALKLDLIQYCHRLTKENFNVTTSLTRMVSDVVRREDNPNSGKSQLSKVKSSSRVSFAEDVGEMVMRASTRMDWELPGFKKRLDQSDASFNGRSNNFSGATSEPAIDLTMAGKHKEDSGSLLGSIEQRSNLSNSLNDDEFESVGSRRTANKSILESGEEEVQRGRADLTISRATRSDVDFNDIDGHQSRATRSNVDFGDHQSRVTGSDANIEDHMGSSHDIGEEMMSERSISVLESQSQSPFPYPPPLPPISPGRRSGGDGGMSGIVTPSGSVGCSSRTQSRAEEPPVVKEQVQSVTASMESFSLPRSGVHGDGSVKGGVESVDSGLRRNDGVGQGGDADNMQRHKEITRSMVSFANSDEQDMLDDLVNSLGDAFEIKSGKDADDISKSGKEMEDDNDGEENDQDEEEFDESKIRCRGALLALHVGKFLTEKSEFEQAEEMLMIAYDRIIDMFPLTHQEQLLLVEVQESIGERHLFQLRKEEASRFFNKALRTLEHIMEEESYDNVRPLLESKGRLLNRLGNMAVHDSQIEEGEAALLEASQCMKEANSVAGIATAQFNLGYLKLRIKDYEAAMTCLYEALQTRERWYGSAHPLVAEVLNELAGLHCKYDNEYSYDRLKAEFFYRRALQIREESVGKDHLLVATTLYHLGKLLREDGSYQSKKEALSLMQRALDIRVTKLGTDHPLACCIRNSLKALRKSISRGDYDCAPVKPPDKRTRDNPRSSLSWRDQDLQSVGGRSASRSPSRRGSRASGASPSPSRRGSGMGGRHSPRNWAGEDRSPSPLSHKPRGGSLRGSVQYQRGKINGQSDLHRDRAQSVPIIRYGRETKDGPKARNAHSGATKMHGAGDSGKSTNVSGGSGTPQNSSRPASSTSSSSSSSSNKGPTLKAKYLYNGRTEGREDGVSFAEGHTVLGSSEMDDATALAGERKGGQKSASVSGRSYSAVSSSTWNRGPKSASSEASSATCRRDIPSPYDTRINGPNSQITSLMADTPQPGPNAAESLHDAAWYHGKGRYPKDQRDFYPPRRHQQRPNRHVLPQATPTSQDSK